MARKKKETTDEVKEKPLGPFDIINTMFYGTNEEFDKFPLDVLAKFYYIINDRMSVKWPLQAAVLNHWYINPAQVVKCWQIFIKSQRLYGRQDWLRVPGKAKTAEQNQQNNILDKKLIKQFAFGNDYSLRDVEAALNLFPEETTKEILAYDEHLKEFQKIKESIAKSIEVEKNNGDEVEIELDMQNIERIF